MARRALTIFLLITVLTPAFTQESSNFTQFYMNPYRINPSYAGIEGRSGLFLTYRKQWVDIEGAPTISNLSYHTAMKSNLNFGINVNSDVVGIINTTAFAITFGYTLPLAKEQYLRFGISGGLSMNQLDLDAVSSSAGLTPSDVSTLLDQNLYAIGDVGFSYHNKFFNIGASIPNIFERQLASFDNFSLGEISALDEFIFYSSYRFYFAQDKFAFEPHGIYRFNKVLPSQFEGAGLLHINHTLWLGGSYKQNFGISALGGVKVNGLFALGYSYSLSNSGDNEINSPTHEVQLNLLLGKKRKKKHVYSFVDSKKPVKKKTKRQLLAEKHKEEQAKLAAEKAEQKKKEEEERTRKEVQERKAQAEATATAQREREKEQQAQRESEQQAQREREAQEAEQQRQTEAEQQRQVQAEVESKTETETETETNVTEPISQEIENSGISKDNFTNDERVVVKRGKHFLELQVGDYVVVGAFGVFENAEKYSDRLHEQGFSNKFGYITETKLWYVHLYESNDIEKARTERDKYRKMSLFRKAWVLGVEQ